MSNAPFRAVVCSLFVAASITSAGPPEPAPAPLKLSGPHTVSNLTIFLVHGPDRIAAKDVVTLSEAFQQNIVAVNETSQVSELSIENRSATATIFVQSGEIVKGGKQDRVIARDMLVPPKSGTLPLPSHCVENGRWQQRGAESASGFSKSDNILASRGLKVANSVKADQRGVWDNVRETQSAISGRVGASVNHKESPTSLQLSLEHPKVQAAIAELEKKLACLPDGKTDVVGYAFAINGRMNSAEVYGSSTLFRKLWPRLLKASAIEAVSEHGGSRWVEPQVAIAETFLSDAEKSALAERKPQPATQGFQSRGGRAVQQQVVVQTTTTTKTEERLKVYYGETGRSNLVESRDVKQKGEWLHRSYYAK